MSSDFSSSGGGSAKNMSSAFSGSSGKPYTNKLNLNLESVEESKPPHKGQLKNRPVKNLINEYSNDSSRIPKPNLSSNWTSSRSKGG